MAGYYYNPCHKNGRPRLNCSGSRQICLLFNIHKERDSPKLMNTDGGWAEIVAEQVSQRQNVQASQNECEHPDFGQRRLL
jgi:hypothetical protein